MNRFVFTTLILSLVVETTKAKIINVPTDQPTIQAAINTADAGDTVLVQPGTYVENINFNGKNIVVGSLFITTNDTSYISTTVIDGNKSGSVVTLQNNEDSTAVLSGFTITNGQASRGGGIDCYDSDPGLLNLIVCDNSANDKGGGLYFEVSNPCLVNVTVSHNNTNRDGGGIYFSQSSPNLKNVTVIGNKADWEGGGFYLWWDSNLSMENVILEGNLANNKGGGIYCHNSNPALHDIIIRNNESPEGGGLHCVVGSSLRLTNVTISGNHCIDGGGLYLDMHSNASLTNVAVTSNSGIYNGGGIYCVDNSKLTLENVTISNNRVVYPFGGGGISSANNSKIIIMNTILWNNLPQGIEIGSDLDTLTISYSDIQGGKSSLVGGTVNWLQGNIDPNPQFADTLNFYLSTGSPCIDAGNPDPAYNDPADSSNPGFALFPAMGGLRNDMGAYGGPLVSGWLATDVKEKEPENLTFPEGFQLFQNYPNPFNSSTTIKFSLPHAGFVTLKVYNILGEEVATLVAENLIGGNYHIKWDGSGLSSGVYYYRLEVDGFIETRKLILLK